MFEIKAIELNQDDFEPYGEVIGPQKTKPAISEPVIDFWPGVSDLTAADDNYQLNWLEVKGIREFVSEQMERHTQSSEALIPVQGSSIVVFGLSENMGDPDSPIDYSTVKAFIFDGSKSINIRKGVWHALPFPLSSKSSFIVIFQKDSHKSDMEIVDLDQKINVKL